MSESLKGRYFMLRDWVFDPSRLADPYCYRRRGPLERLATSALRATLILPVIVAEFLRVSVRACARGVAFVLSSPGIFLLDGTAAPPRRLAAAIMAAPRHFAEAVVTLSPRRLAAGVMPVPRHFANLLLTRSPRQLAACAVLAGVGAGAVSIACMRPAREDVWAAYDRLAGVGDFQAARRELAGLEKRRPDDPQVLRRTAAWRSGEGAADDAEIVFQLMIDHFRSGRRAEAAREAAKCLRMRPDDWHARFILASAAGDRAEAAGIVSHLPNPSRMSRILTAGWARLALELCRRLGDRQRADELLEYLSGRLLRGAAEAPEAAIPPVDMLIILNAHQEALHRFEFRGDLAGSMPQVERLGRRLAGDPRASAEQLEELGRLLELLVGDVGELRRRGLPGFAGQAEAAAAAGRIETLLEEVCGRLLEAAPRRPAAYVLGAARFLRAGRIDDADRLLADGMRLCPPDRGTALTVARSRSLRQSGKAERDGRFLDSLPAGAGDDVRISVLRIESALGSGDLPRALAACRSGVAGRPDSGWARRIEARVCSAMGRPAEAAAALEAVAGGIADAPGEIRLYVAALGLAGRSDDAGLFLTGLQEELESCGVSAAPQLLAGAAGFGDAGRWAEAEQWAETAAATSGPADPAAVRILAFIVLRRLEDGPETWDPAQVRRAVALFREIVERDPEDLAALNSLVWLLVKGLHDRTAAVAVATPLRHAADGRDVPPEVLDTVAALYNLMGEFGSAVSPARRAAAAPKPRLSYRIQLAEALLGMERPAESAAVLDDAGSPGLPANPHEAAEIRTLRERIRRAAAEAKSAPTATGADSDRNPPR